jgi:hypothetical protein
VDSLHQGRKQGFRAAQDEEGGRGTRAGYTSEEKEIKTGGSCIEFLAWFSGMEYFYTQGDDPPDSFIDRITITRDHELIDALWEAVKAVL